MEQCIDQIFSSLIKTKDRNKILFIFYSLVTSNVEKTLYHHLVFKYNFNDDQKKNYFDFSNIKWGLSAIS